MKSLNFASISDVHLGHRNALTIETLTQLRHAFPDTHQTAELDIVFICGDLFDNLLRANQPELIDIKIWIVEFLRLCKRHNILIRVLEGTSSHDWKQNRLLPTLNTIADIHADLKYHENLSIDYIESLDCHVLYVPDEWHASNFDLTWKDVQQLLIEHQLEKVDIAVMHGLFEFQVPAQIKIPTHRLDRYQALS